MILLMYYNYDVDDPLANAFPDSVKVVFFEADNLNKKKTILVNAPSMPAALARSSEVWRSMRECVIYEVGPVLAKKLTASKEKFLAFMEPCMPTEPATQPQDRWEAF